MNRSGKANRLKSILLLGHHILRKIFLEDWLLKLLALVITLALWFVVTGLSTPTTRRLADVPLAISYSNNVEITNSPLQSISIVISGDKRKISQITESALVASIDLSDVPPGDRVINLTPENVKIDLPPGIRLQEIQPARIAIRLETVAEKEIPVRIETQGEPAAGFEVYDASAIPQKVHVRAPVTYLRSLSSVPTEKIDISGRQADFTARQIPVSVSYPKATVIESVVDAVFKIGETRIERTFTVAIPDLQGKRATFTIFGPRSILEKANAADFKIAREKSSELPEVFLPSELEGKAEIRRVRVH
ncbi:MAG: hypothetical protein C4324_05340 [Blastocatellia bacterium]